MESVLVIPSSCNTDTILRYSTFSAPKVKFCQTERLRIHGCCETCRTRRCVGMNTEPSLGKTRWPNNFKNVVLPLACWPTTATKFPWLTDRSIFFNTVGPSLYLKYTSWHLSGIKS